MLKTIITLTFLISGCSTTHQAVPLDLPPRPIFPKVTKVEVQCLTDEVRRTIKVRDILSEGHIFKLEGIIRATHK